jgi:hypothetical protein
LGAGGWRIEAEGLDGSKVRLTIEKPVASDNGQFTVPRIVDGFVEPVLVDGPVCVFAEIIESGKEDFIGIFAYAVGG